MRKSKMIFRFFIRRAVFLWIIVFSALSASSLEGGWSDDVREEILRRREPITIQGVAYLCSPVSGAAVEIYDRHGYPIPSGGGTTGEDGSFSITCSAPESFRIVVSGGTVNGEPFEHDLRCFVPDFREGEFQRVNALTTLMAKYREYHRDAPWTDVEEGMKRFLSIPDPVDMTDVICSSQSFSYYFSHHVFMKEARAAEGLTRFVERLAGEAEEGRVRSFFDSEAVGSALFEDALDSLIDGAKEIISDKATGWILNLLGFGGDDEDETDRRLDEMDKKLDQILSELQNILHALNDLALRLALDINKVEQYIEGMNASDAISAIKTHYDQAGTNSLRYFAGLRSKDAEENRADIESFVRNIKGAWDIQDQVTRIHDAVVPDMGGTKGLLELWTEEFLLHGRAGDDRLMDCYKTLERYFAILLFYQFKGANLVVESMNYASHAPGTDGNPAIRAAGGEGPAYTYLTRTFQPLIKEETDLFLRCVKKLLIRNAGLYDMDRFLPGNAEAILARATFFIVQTLDEDHYGLRAGAFGTRDWTRKFEKAGVTTGGDRFIEAEGDPEDLDVPGKPYDIWGEGTGGNDSVTMGTAYTLMKFDLGPVEAAGAYPFSLLKEGRWCPNGTVSVKTFTKEYYEDPKGGIVFGYRLVPTRCAGGRTAMAGDLWVRGIYEVHKTGDVKFGEEWKQGDDGKTVLRAWADLASGNGEISMTRVNVRRFLYGGSEPVKAWLITAGRAEGSLYRTDGSITCEATTRVGVFDLTHFLPVQVIGYTKKATEVFKTQHWETNWDEPLELTLDPGVLYCVYYGIVGYAKAAVPPIPSSIPDPFKWDASMFPDDFVLTFVRNEFDPNE